MKRNPICLALLFIAIINPAFGQPENLDTLIINRIKKEGLNNSKVMEIAFQLTDVNGPRLTNSAGYKRAANYAEGLLKEWGLVNATFDTFGEFGKGWELKHFYMAMTTPYYKPLIALPRAWTAGTKGLQSAEVFLIDAKDISELKKYKDKLAGKILIVHSNNSFKHNFEADTKRFSDVELKKMEEAKAFVENDHDIKATVRKIFQQPTPPQQIESIHSALLNMAKEEGAIAVLNFAQGVSGGTLSVGGITGYKTGESAQVPDIMLTLEDYMTILRLVKANVPVKFDVEIKTEFNSQHTLGYNVIAEIPGTDNRLTDEVVMIGAHLDSWHGATGATDNAAGVAVIMEAVRILKALDIKPRRPIRIALWGGEEQRLLGSKGYIKKTFIDTTDWSFLPSHEKFSVYYNLDNGGGKIRGIYLEGNEGARPIFSKWLEPFNSAGAKTITANSTRGTDHSTFNRIGLPGFQFIQDPLDYDTKTHHTNLDSYDHLIADDLKQSAIIIASILYHSAMRDGKFPRK